MFSRLLAIAAACLAAAASPVLAEPLWEAGAGAAALSLPDYRGSNERHGYVLPFPYVVYRGDRLRIDRNGMFASLFDSERVELDLSFTGNFALRSDGNQARAGMPALHPVLEGGPELVVHLIGRPHRREPRLDLRLAARAAIAVGGGRVTNAGFTGAPYLRLDLPDGLGSGFDVTATLGLLYGDRRHHGYLYSVEPQYATATRPAYDAPGGYAGVQSQISAGRRFGRLWVGGYLRLDSLRGASALEASPLVRSRQYTAAGLAVAWVIGASSQSGASGD